MSHDGALLRIVRDVEQFEAEYWGSAPLLVRADADTGGFSDVWSIAAHDEFLANAVRAPLVRLIRSGEPIPVADYTSRVRLGGTDFKDVIDPTKVAEHFAAGATVVAQSLHRTHPTVRRFVGDLAQEISHPVQANSYLTPPDATGLAPHADLHDVFAVQIEGTKVWHVDGLGEVELRPGDAMYVPAGARHSATSTDEPSLHLTIGILRVTYRAVLKRMLRTAPTTLDDPLPLRYRSESTDLASNIERMLDDVGGHLRSLSSEDWATSEASRRLTRPPSGGALTAAASTWTIDATSTIERCPASWSLTESEGLVRVEADGSALTAPVSCRPALEQLAPGRPVVVDDLDGLDAPSRSILARRLVGTGLCVFAHRHADVPAD